MENFTCNPCKKNPMLGIIEEDTVMLGNDYQYHDDSNTFWWIYIGIIVVVVIISVVIQMKKIEAVRNKKGSVILL